LNDRARQRPALAQVVLGIAGIVLIAAARYVDRQPWQVYSVYDYWHTSPSFFVTRVGILMLIVFASYAWCRWGLGQWGFSPMIQLGTTSLLVYWVHIEFVYGRVSILPKRNMGIGGASLGLLTIFLAMLALSTAKTYWKRKRAAVVGVARPASAT